MTDQESEIVELMTRRNDYVLRLTLLNADLLKHTQIHSGLQVDELGLEESDGEEHGSDEMALVKEDQNKVEQAIMSTEEEIISLEEKISLIDQQLSDMNDDA